MTFRYLIMFTQPYYRKKIYSDIKNYQNIIDFDKNYNFINKFLKVETLKYDLESAVSVKIVPEATDVKVEPSFTDQFFSNIYSLKVLERQQQ